MSTELFRAVASCNLLYPGTLTSTPPNYMHTIKSDPMPYEDALHLLGQWRDAVSRPICWHFSVLSSPAADPLKEGRQGA